MFATQNFHPRSSTQEKDLLPAVIFRLNIFCCFSVGHGSEHNIWNKIFKMDQVKFVEKSHLKIFKGCHSQISLGSFLNTLSHLLQ